MLETLQKFNTPPAKDARELHAHFSGSYFSIRLGLALTAFAFPLLLYFIGRGVYGIGLQPSMSAYFWAADATHCASFPLRTVFVGILIAIAAALHFYKGLTDLENWLLNFAAIFALVVALVPENLEYALSSSEPPPPQRIMELYSACPAVDAWAKGQALAKAAGIAVPYHYSSAVLMFVCLFFVALLCACKSLEYLPDNAPLTEGAFKKLYRWTAWSMVIYGGVLGVLVFLNRKEPGSLVFWLEAGEVWIFAFYWAVKTWELSLSKLEKDPPAAVAEASRKSRSGSGLDRVTQQATAEEAPDVALHGDRRDGRE